MFMMVLDRDRVYVSTCEIAVRCLQYFFSCNISSQHRVSYAVIRLAYVSVGSMVSLNAGFFGWASTRRVGS